MSGRVGFGSNAQRGIYPILSIDGGGIRGIIPATVLVKIEEITRRPISSLFQLIGGTSTGGLIALGLTATEDGKTPKYTAREVLDIYTKRYDEIFKINDNYDAGSGVLEKIRSPIYQTPSILLEEVFGDVPLSAALTDVLITANELGAIINKAGSVGLNVITALVSMMAGAMTGQPTAIYSHDSIPKTIHLFTKNKQSRLSYEMRAMQQFFSSIKRDKNPYEISERPSDFYMRDVAQVTSAAPTYFPPLQFGNDVYLDGGVLQNNPAIPCVVEALEKKVPKEALFMVSLGTGLDAEDALKRDFQSLAISTWFQTVQNDAIEEEILTAIVPRRNYRRLQYKFETSAAPSLDAHSPEVISALEGAGQRLVDDNITKITALCKILSPDTCG